MGGGGPSVPSTPAPAKSEAPTISEAPSIETGTGDEVAGTTEIDRRTVKPRTRTSVLLEELNDKPSILGG